MPFEGLADMFSSAAQIDGQRMRDTANYFINKESSSRQYRRTKKLMALQMANELKLAKDMPSARMTGLRDAGLNPILAAGGNFGGGSAASGQAAKGDSLGSASVSLPSIGSTLNSAQAIKNQKMVQDKQVENLDAQNNLLTEQAMTERDKQGEIRARTETEKNRPENVRSNTELNKHTADLRKWQAFMEQMPAQFYADHPELIIYRDGDVGAGAVKMGKDVIDTAVDWLKNWYNKRVDNASSAAEADKKETERKVKENEAQAKKRASLIKNKR